LVAPEIQREISRHVQAEWPNEACGVLIGARDTTVWRVEGYVAADNVHLGDRGHSFLMDPAVLLTATLDHGPGAILGFFHSHPTGPADPSDDDLAGTWAGHLMMIWGTAAGKIEEIEAWYVGNEVRRVEVVEGEIGAD
jgi:proteasome lid subunit RPN8/RPN11